jgi:hypothetical protein
MICLCWDISEYEYDLFKEFWDDWVCKECNNGVARNIKEYYSRHPRRAEIFEVLESEFF